MSTARLRVLAGAYRDSLMLLSATRAMVQSDGVEWATAVMALPANVADLAADGFTMSDLDSAEPTILCSRSARRMARRRAPRWTMEGRSSSPSLARLTRTEHGRHRRPSRGRGATARRERRHDIGYPVRVFALGDPAAGFYRPVRAPVTIVPAPPALPTLAASGPLTATWQRGCASAPEPPADR